jgi:hypothetical protein
MGVKTLARSDMKLSSHSDSVSGGGGDCMQDHAACREIALWIQTVGEIGGRICGRGSRVYFEVIGMMGLCRTVQTDGNHWE